MVPGPQRFGTDRIVTPTRRALRLMVKPSSATRSEVDGGWWPWSTDPAMEFPELVLALSSWIGPVNRVAYDMDAWDATPRNLIVGGWTARLAGVHTIPAHTVLLSSTKMRQLSLLVIPPGTPAGAARALLRLAASRDNVDAAADILAGKGVQVPVQSE